MDVTLITLAVSPRLQELYNFLGQTTKKIMHVYDTYRLWSFSIDIKLEIRRYSLCKTKYSKIHPFKGVCK